MKILTFIAITMLSSCYTSLDNTKVNLFSNLNNVSISDKEFEFKSWIGTRNKLGEFMPSINHKGKILFNDNKLYSMSNFSSDTFLIYDFNLEIKDTVASCIDSRLQFNSITEKICFDLILDSIFIDNVLNDKIYKFTWKGIDVYFLKENNSSFINHYYSEKQGLIGMTYGFYSYDSTSIIFNRGTIFDSLEVKKNTLKNFRIF